MGIDELITQSPLSIDKKSELCKSEAGMDINEQIIQLPPSNRTKLTADITGFKESTKYQPELPKIRETVDYKDKIQQSEGPPSEYKYIKCLFANCEFIKNKLDILRCRVSLVKPDIIALVETGTQEAQDSPYYLPDECLYLDGYTLHRQDNSYEVKGGIIIYTKDDLQISEPPKKLRNISSEFKEAKWLVIKQQQQNILFGAVYRKGASNAHNNKLMRDMLTIAAKSYDNIMVCGDFNFPNINWDNNTVVGSTYCQASRFVDCLDDNFLCQHVHEFTRKRGKDKESLLDLIITDSYQSQISESVEVTSPLGKSDHGVVIWNYLTTIKEEEKVEATPKLNYHKGNYDKLKQLCLEEDWTTLLNEKGDESIDITVEAFYSKLNEFVKECIPTKETKVKDRPPWMNRTAADSIKSKDHSWKRFQINKSRKNYLDYVKQRNKTTKKIRKAKKLYEKRIAEECKKNPKLLYQYCNFKRASKSNIIRLKNKSGQFLMSNQDNANELNNFFQSVFTKEEDIQELIFNQSSKLLFDDLDPQEPFNFRGKLPQTTINEITVTTDDVYELLSSLDPYKSAPQACLHPRLLKEAAAELAEPLRIIFSKSIKECKVPQTWKEGVVTPIYKNGDRHVAKNYRPVTITSLLCRTLERIIKKQITKHIDDNDLLSAQQHGFRNKRSCVSNLLEAMDSITDMLDNGWPVDEIFLDISKAFDTVPHQRLLYKLSRYGIQGDLLTWIESFLTGRTQRVRVKDKFSDAIEVTSGVPQGSVLGPLLFLLYIDDISTHCVHSQSKIFADDTKIYCKVCDIQDAELLQKDLDNIYAWSKEWNLKFNASKCNILHYGKKNERFLYHLNGNLIDSRKEEKDLGVYISEDMKFQKQLQTCVAKANKLLAMIRTAFTYLTKDIFLQLYKVYVRPILEYGQEIWSPYLHKDIDVLEKVQQRATKLIPELQDLPYDDRLHQLRLYSLKARRERGDMITMYKIHHGLIDLDYDALFTRSSSNIHTRQHGHQLQFKRCNSDTRRNTFSQRIIVPWNTLPKSIISSESVESFKRGYDRYKGLWNY